MARYTGPVCRLCRREGEKLFLKGDRCYSNKCAIERRNGPPGVHWKSRGRFSEYRLQLREKQKVKRMYGMVEKQFRSVFHRADRQKGVTGETLLRLLESRLDNIVYRGGFASSRNEGRQLVRHGHFHVNGRTVDIPSYTVKPGDVVALVEKSRNMARVNESLEAGKARRTPEWLYVEPDVRRLTVKALPAREQVTHPINEQLIVELYSR